MNTVKVISSEHHHRHLPLLCGNLLANQVDMLVVAVLELYQ